MTNYNFIEKYIRAPYDFKISNQVTKEKMGKAIGFMLFGYLIFVLVIAIIANFTILPEMNNLIDEFKVSIDEMPDFTIENGQLKVEGSGYHVFGNEEMYFIIDTDLKHDDAYYFSQYKNYYLMRSDRLIANGQVFYAYDNLQGVFNKESLKVLPDTFVTLLVVAGVILAIFGIIGLFFVAVLVWGIIIIINGFLRIDISSGDCFKLAAYAMYVPGILLLVNALLPYTMPGLFLVYLALAGFYGYMYLKHYEVKRFDVNSILEAE